MRQVWARVLGVVAFVAANIAADPAVGSPWTLPKDELAVDLTYDFSYANSEFLPAEQDRGLQSFPLDGQFFSNQLGIGARYGFTDDVEGIVDIAFKQVSYSARPWLADDPANLEDRADAYSRDGALFNFSESRGGAGDFRFGLRYNLWSKGELLKLTSETNLKLPAGYEPPSGTFEEGEPSPGAIRDDVALGDGQVDLAQRIYFGGYVPATRTFGRADAGFKFRFGPPGHQVEGQLKIGQNVADNVLLFGGANGAFTVIEGSTIGSSFIATEPNAEPYELNPGENVKKIPIGLDKDCVQLSGGAIFQLKRAELQLAYHQIVWGNNIPAIKTASASTVFRLPNITGGDSE